MNCPNCKNPANENSTICEWCGADLLTSSNNQHFVKTKNKNKAIKLTVYTILLVFATVSFIVNDTGDFQFFYVIAPPIIIYELYNYLKNKLS